MLTEVRKRLRAPSTIVAELAGIALAGVLSTVVEQGAGASAGRAPLLARVVGLLGLDRIFETWWFLALVVLAGISLAIVLVEQWRRAARQWSAPVSDAVSRSAVLRAEFERPSRGATSRVEIRNRIGLLGSPIFHLGLMVVLLAGLGRLLFAAEGSARLYEGETTAPGSGALDGYTTGWLASPPALGVPLEIASIEPERHASGQLKSLTARIVVHGRPPREETLAINAPLALGGERLYLTAVHGCAAFLALERGTGAERRVFLLEEASPREFVATIALEGGLELRLRGMGGFGGEPPTELEVRAVRGGALLVLAKVSEGRSVGIPGGRLSVHALRRWARFVVARDLSTWPAYAGFTLALVGAILIFMVIRVEVAVTVSSRGETERVVVALRPDRLTPLFRGDFERLVRDEGGGAESLAGAPRA